VFGDFYAATADIDNLPNESDQESWSWYYFINSTIWCTLKNSEEKKNDI